MFTCSFQMFKTASLPTMTFAEWPKQELQVSSQNIVYMSQHDCDERL